MIVIMMYKAWTTKAAKQPTALETVDLGPLRAQDVEVAVEHCGLCHSDLSVFNNGWGISQYPAILGHEVVAPVTAVGPNANGVQVGLPLSNAAGPPKRKKIAKCAFKA
jgi:uncharacterized zinc-type alcohol dehydrogenase-like protein